MKKLCFVLILVLFLFGCAHVHTISQLEEKWGPPTKVEKFEDKTTYYYYYRHDYVKTKPGGLTVRGDSVPGAAANYTTDWVIYEFTADDTGKIIEEKKYTKRPKLD